MMLLPNPFEFDSACIADALTVPCDAPIQCTVSEVIGEPASIGPCHGPASTPTLAAGVPAISASAGFSSRFSPDMDALERSTLDLHPRDLDLDRDPSPLFLRNPSEAYLDALRELAGRR